MAEVINICDRFDTMDGSTAFTANDAHEFHIWGSVHSVN
jgi:hypothetical protein